MNLPDVSEIDIDLLLRRLTTDYPQGYNYKVLRQAAAVIKFYREDSELWSAEMENKNA